ncbi:MAG: transglutaminase-like domain-containing protein [Planctomycetota bacterium]|jgi:hypothetical protein
MKRLLLTALLLVVFSGELTSRERKRLWHSDEERIEFIQNAKKRSIIKRSYKIETAEELVLKPGQSAHLDFEDNPAGVKEFIFFYNDEQARVHIIHGCTDEAEEGYNWTSLRPERLRDHRGICATGKKYLNIFSECKFKYGKAFVKFRTTLSLSEKDREEIKEIKEAIRRSRAAEQRAELKAVSELEWDFDEKIKPFKIIMDDPNEPNMIKLRKKYDLEGLVSKAKDDYEKLMLITAWVQKQWKHSGNNKPSRSDPLTILKEASEGKRFRCVEYAIVVAGCARSLGMPSRKLALKRADVETAKSGAGHVVAEVWLEQFNKWVFVDGQYGAIAEKDGVPLNAVELQDAIAGEVADLKIQLATKKDEIEYLAWVARYLYYFDFNLDQRFYKGETEKERISGSRGKIMLVPRGAAKPKVFQRRFPIRGCTYISNPECFYLPMSKR